MRKARKCLGYAIIWNGAMMSEVAGEDGRLYNCGTAHLWPTRAAARRAIARSVKAWNEYMDRAETPSAYKITRVVERPTPEAR